MRQFEINVDKGAQWFIWELGATKVTAAGAAHTSAPFGICRKNETGLLVAFDGHIDADMIKAVREDPLFDETVVFSVKVDDERKRGMFEGTFVDGLLWLLNRKEEYGL